MGRGIQNILSGTTYTATAENFHRGATKSYAWGEGV